MANEKVRLDIMMLMWNWLSVVAVGVAAIIGDLRSEDRVQETADNLTKSAASTSTSAVAATAGGSHNNCNATVKSSASDAAIVGAAVPKLETTPNSASSTSTSAAATAGGSHNNCNEVVKSTASDIAITIAPVKSTTSTSTSTSTAAAAAAATSYWRRNTVMTIVLLVGIGIVLFYGVRAVKSSFTAQENHENERDNERDELFRMMNDALTSMNVHREGNSIVLEPPNEFWKFTEVFSRVVDESLPPDVRELLKHDQIRELLKHFQIRGNLLSNRKMIYISDDFWRTALQVLQSPGTFVAIEEEFPDNDAASSQTRESTSASDPQLTREEVAEESDNGDEEGSDDAVAAARKYALKGKAIVEE